MTSSLVGSEMCIRDRIEAGRGGSQVNTREQHMKLHIASGDSGVAAYMAVSYTHLTLPTICSV
eukprot:923829-Prorocentrum_lima.AAC.1